MSRLIASCQNKPDNDQETCDVTERTFIRLQTESIQNILKTENFVSLRDLSRFTNQFCGQINSKNLGENVTSSSKNLVHLTNKTDELCTETGAYLGGAWCHGPPFGSPV